MQNQPECCNSGTCQAQIGLSCAAKLSAQRFRFDLEEKIKCYLGTLFHIFIVLHWDAV